MTYDEDDGLYVVRTTAGERVPRPPPRPRHRHPAATSREACRGLGGDFVHNSRYLQHKAELQAKESITLVGSGQSAAEIYYDLLCEIDVHGYRLNWVTRSPRFFPLEYTKLTLEMTSPEYVDYFHALPEDDPLPAGRAEQKGLFKGIDGELDRRDLRPALPEEPAAARSPTRLLTNSSLDQARRYATTARTRSAFRQEEQGKDFELEHRGPGPGHRLPVRRAGVPRAGPRPAPLRRARAASTSPATTPSTPPGRGVFLQNARRAHPQRHLAPTSAWAPTATRTSSVSCSAREYYPVEKTIAFQEFAA